jgi:hypothetical protein
MNEVAYISPEIAHGAVSWPYYCTAACVTDEVLRNRMRLGKPLRCGKRAKINFRGTMLCIKHAQARALSELLLKTPSNIIPQEHRANEHEHTEHNAAAR